MYSLPSKILDIEGHQLYLGNIYNTRSLVNANPWGIQAVLDVSTEEDYVKNRGVVYLRVPFPDGFEIPAVKFALCMEFLKDCWEKNLTVLVNCAAGISRSTGIVCSFIHSSGIGMTNFNPSLDTLDKVLEYVAVCRPIVQPAPSVFASCKKHLKIWPYDGSLGVNEPYVRLDRISFARYMKLHPNKTCPVRLSILANDNTERHLLQCTCGLTL